MSQPSRIYLTYRAMWFEKQADKFLSCGEKEKAGALMRRAREYRIRAEELPFEYEVREQESRDTEPVTCIGTQCHSCDTPIYVPIWDFHAERNYCYPCAWSRIGEVNADTHVG